MQACGSTRRKKTTQRRQNILWRDVQSTSEPGNLRVNCLVLGSPKKASIAKHHLPILAGWVTYHCLPLSQLCIPNPTQHQPLVIRFLFNPSTGRINNPTHRHRHLTTHESISMTPIHSHCTSAPLRKNSADGSPGDAVFRKVKDACIRQIAASVSSMMINRSVRVFRTSPPTRDTTKTKTK